MMQFNIDKFSAVIDLYIQMNNLSNAEFAELVGIGQSTLYNLKNGTLAPNMAQFVSICNLTGFQPDAFFRKVIKNGSK